MELRTGLHQCDMWIPGIPECGPEVFNYLTYFKRNPKFAQAFASYEPLLTINQFSVYRRR